ncbi:MAG TPA: hypothetical protein VK675_03040 [Candidatus Paceibacterota bacterium]|nr:hypothetical protein [Candidatus Paceibacterota bacterium]
MKIHFAQFDPRPQGAEANNAIFSLGPVIGIEVTISALADRCVVNIDHHGFNHTSETPSACERAPGQFDYLPEGETLVFATVRPDADSVTAMAYFLNLVENRQSNRDLIKQIGRFDRLGPSAGKPSAVVTAIARKACDFKLPLKERVQWVADLLVGADKSDEIATLNAARDSELEAARKASELSLRADDRIACVVSTHRFATNLGYESAAVVVAMNPYMLVDSKDPAKGTYRKFTVCRYDSHVPCDLPAALVELQELEPGWGGRGDIFGSPQGVSSILPFEKVVEVVSRHLK